MAKVSRRSFVRTVSAAGAAMIGSKAVSPVIGAPQRMVMQQHNGAISAVVQSPDEAVCQIDSIIAMNSGVALGGIGTGFIELRPDGCFYEWLIFNNGPWAGGLPANLAGVSPGMGPASLQFLVRTQQSGQEPKLRRLALRAKQNNLYSFGYVQDVESITFDAWFPMTTLRYGDSTLPVNIKADVFSPFIPGNARESGSPGFYLNFTIENTSNETITVSLLSLLDNPLARGCQKRMLSNAITQHGSTTALTMRTDATPESKTTIGSLCLSATGGKHSWISGTYSQYLGTRDLPVWHTRRVNFMLIDALQPFFAQGKLPNAAATHDPAETFTLSDVQINGLSAQEAAQWIAQLSQDAMLQRVFTDASLGSPDGKLSVEAQKQLLREVRRNLHALAGESDSDSSWGAGALASEVVIAPGASAQVRFALSWHFPHHFSRYGEDMGHMYANWFKDAADVNAHLTRRYDTLRSQTELFARTLADTSLGGPMAFAWSSQLCTAVASTWWVKAGHYSIWEGLGCCGQSTIDVDFSGNFGVTALFPELSLSRMTWMLQFQRPNGQVPHTYAGDFSHVDQGGWGRVDLNPMFVMMTLRDYLWTGDRTYLKGLWPHVVKAMEYTASLDTNGDGLPDKDTGYQSYDQWGLRGSPSYVCSLWLGALKAGIVLAEAQGQPAQAQAWRKILAMASQSFDKLLFNGRYYRLWADGSLHSDMCMTDQLSGEWFTHLIGLKASLPQAHLQSAWDSVFRFNFDSQTGVRNATAPHGGRGLLVLNNLQAGGVWSGIEYAFASCMMDHGNMAAGSAIVEAVHQRYRRAGSPWNQVECGDHYARAMSSWTTLLAATGFKPDMPHQTLALMPPVIGDFHAPWVMAGAFGTLRQRKHKLELTCLAGELQLKALRVRGLTTAMLRDSKPVQIHRADGDAGTIEFGEPLHLKAGSSLIVS